MKARSSKKTRSVRRYLNEDLVRSLNEQAKDQSSWWYKLITDPKVFIALRDGYLNAYVNGGSVARIGYWRRQLTCKVHLEYLTLPVSGTPYVDLAATGNTAGPRSLIADLESYAKEFRRIKTRTGLFIDAERQDENTIASGLPCVIDMELAYKRAATMEPVDENPELVPEGRRSKGGRIDLVVALEDGRLVFAEIKLWSNNELRADGTPEICKQLGDYHKWIKNEEDSVIDAYSNAIEILDKLDGRFFNKRKLPRPTSLKVDPIPRLIVLGYDTSKEPAVRDAGKKVVSLMRKPPFNVSGFSDKHVIYRGDAKSVSVSDFADVDI